MHSLPRPLRYDQGELTLEALRCRQDGRQAMTPHTTDRLLEQVGGMVRQSGEPAGFDAAAWLSPWLSEPLPALSGARPTGFLNTAEGEAQVSTILARTQSGAHS